MTVQGVLADGRQRALLLMTDSCTVTRAAGVTGPLDPVTLMRPVAEPTLIYSGPCRVRMRRPSNAAGQPVGGDSTIAEDWTLSVPTDSPRLEVQDVIVLTAALYHPVDVGLRGRIISPNPESQATASRYQVESIVG